MLLNGNLYDYKVPTALDQPKFGPFPSRRVAAAGPTGRRAWRTPMRTRVWWGQAIQNATGGDFIEMIPYTPDKVLAVLGKIAQ